MSIQELLREAYADYQRADMELAGMIALEQLMILLERQEKGN